MTRAEVAKLLRERRQFELHCRDVKHRFDSLVNRGALPAECLLRCCRSVAQLEAEIALTDAELLRLAGAKEAL